MADLTGVAIVAFVAALVICWVQARRHKPYDSDSDRDEGDEDSARVRALEGVDTEARSLIPDAAGNMSHSETVSAKQSSAWYASVRDPLALLFASGPRKSGYHDPHSVKRPGGTKRYHKAQFYPLLQETAQWWESRRPSPPAQPESRLDALAAPSVAVI